MDYSILIGYYKELKGKVKSLKQADYWSSLELNEMEGVEMKLKKGGRDFHAFFSKDGKVIKCLTYSKHLPEQLTIYLYDDYDQILEQISQYVGSRRFNGRTTYTYDAKKRLVLQEQTLFLENEEAVGEYKTLDYDDLERICETRHYENYQDDDVLVGRCVDYYDETGKIIRSVCFDEEDKILYDENLANPSISEDRRYEYKYDSNGSWIEETYYFEDEPKRITKREIDYY